MAIGEKKPIVMEFDRAVPGGVATLDENGKLVESQRVVKSNPTLLINWYFPNPVNRNGKREYTAVGYTIDMWRKTSTKANGVLLVEKTGLIAKSGSPVIRQYFEDKPAYVGKTLTASILFDNNELLTATQTVTAETFRVLYTSRLYFDSNASENEVFAVSVPADVHVIAAKLELGSVQTLAHQENGQWVLNEIPNYAEQYAICEQYSPITGEFVGSQQSNPNLLDNWYFADPVNQRGQTVYVNGYAIDRWRIRSEGVSCEVKGNGILLTSTEGSASYNNFIQRLETNWILGKTVTISALVDDMNIDNTGIKIGLYAGNTSELTSLTLLDSSYTIDSGLIAATGKLPDSISYSGINFVMWLSLLLSQIFLEISEVWQARPTK